MISDRSIWSLGSIKFIPYWFLLDLKSRDNGRFWPQVSIHYHNYGNIPANTLIPAIPANLSSVFAVKFSSILMPRLPGFTRSFLFFLQKIAWSASRLESRTTHQILEKGGCFESATDFNLDSYEKFTRRKPENPKLFAKKWQPIHTCTVLGPSTHFNTLIKLVNVEAFRNEKLGTLDIAV